MDEADTANLAAREKSELGLGNSLDQLLLRDTALGNGLESLDRLLSDLLDGRSLARDLDSQEASIRVGVVGGPGDSAGGGSGGLGEEREAGRPLDVGLAAEEACKNGGLRLTGTEGSAGEGNDHRVAGNAGDTSLTTVILGGGGAEGRAGDRDGLEEGLNPLLKSSLAGAVGDNGDVGLGVGRLSESGNGVLVQVGVNGSAGSRVDGGTEAGVESNRVGGIEGNGRGADPGLLEVDDILDLLVELVGYNNR